MKKVVACIGLVLCVLGYLIYDSQEVEVVEGVDPKIVNQVKADFDSRAKKSEPIKYELRMKEWQYKYAIGRMVSELNSPAAIKFTVVEHTRQALRIDSEDAAGVILQHRFTFDETKLLDWSKSNRP